VPALIAPARPAATGLARGAETPLNVLELLWINLIMDALAALGPLPRQCLLRQFIFWLHVAGQVVAVPSASPALRPRRTRQVLVRCQAPLRGMRRVPVADPGRPLLRAALATELPSEDLLLEAPHGRTESVISPRMWKHILVQGCYQIGVLMLVIYAAPRLIDKYSVRRSPQDAAAAPRPAWRRALRLRSRAGTLLLLRVQV